MHWLGQGKHLGFPFARGWVGRINQQHTATRVFVYTEVRKAQKQRRSSQPSWPCTRPTQRVRHGWHGCFLGQQKPPSSSSQASPPQLLLPGPWATQEKQCSCNFLISVYSSQVESTCNWLPCVSGYMQRQVSITVFSVVGISPIYAPWLHVRHL